MKKESEEKQIKDHTFRPKIDRFSRILSKVFFFYGKNNVLFRIREMFQIQNNLKKKLKKLRKNYLQMK